MSDAAVERATRALERIAVVLAALYAQQLKDLDQGQKAKRLHHLGFSNVQIAHALATTSNSINVALHRARKSTKGAKKAKPGRRA
jgi:DNA-directed RNA polymerase specialized sigma24 family protein